MERRSAERIHGSSYEHKLVCIRHDGGKKVNGLHLLLIHSFIHAIIYIIHIHSYTYTHI